MKKKISILVLLLIVFASCQQEEKKAEKIAYAYLNAMANYRVDEAEMYATPETSKTTLVLSKQLLAMVDTAYIISDTPAKIDIQELVIQDDTLATVKYVKNTPLKQNMQGELLLVKRGKQWLAHDVLN
jgi:outer membrane lipoprotein-sorting protein